MKRAACLLWLSLALLSANAAAQKTWTILVYLNGDNDLWRAAVEDFNELEMVGSTPDVDVIVQIDLPVSMFGRPPFNDTRRYFIEQDPDGENTDIVSTRLWPESGTEELDMGSPDTLSDFVWWGMEHYPAEHYALFIWDHGDGWKASPSPKPSPPLKEISDDVTSGTSISISEGELMESMDHIYYHLGEKLDLLALDACLMGMWEVDVVLEDYVNYVVHSEESEDEDGYDYTALMTFLQANPDASADMLCESIVRGSIDSVGATLSCVDLRLLDTVSTAVDNLSAGIIDALDAHEREIESCAGYALRFGDGEFADLHNFAGLLVSSAGLPSSLSDAAGQVQAAVEGAVVCNEARGFCRNAGGISIYLPVASEYYPFDPAYTEGAGAIWSAYGWDEMLCSFSGLVCAPDAYEPDDTREEAKEIGAADPVQERSLYPLHDTDFVTARVWQGMDYTFSTEGSLDTYMWLLDGETLSEIATDDDGGTDHNALIAWTADFDGSVYLKIQHWGTTIGWGAETGAYRLVMTWEGCSQEDVPVCSQEGVCAGTERVCDGGIWQCPYPDTYAETDGCDSLDNDCDGSVDEDYVPYTCGLGECEAESTCTGGLEQCIPLDPPAETDSLCDGRDEDCDGQIDEDAQCPPCDPDAMPQCLQQGVCAGTAPECVGGEWQCNYPDSYSGRDDTCDGLDNNCNGRIDEDADCSENLHPVRAAGSGLGCSIALVR